MKILITGHCGFVGRNFVKKYIDHDITGIDIKNGNDCREFFKISDTKFDLVIHLSAIVGGRATIEGNPLSVASDLSIDSEFFQWALRTRPGRIVYFSSSAAYPIHLQTTQYKLKESDIDLANVSNPDMTYGWSKLTGEYCLQFLRAEGLKVHIFRPFSGYGPDQDLNYPFPTYIKRAKNLENPFTIWGDGTQVRDFIHITDIVNAVDAAIKQDFLETVNLGWSRPTSFNELCELVCKQMKYRPEINYILTAPKGVDYRCSDNSKMLTFYRPKISLEEGIATCLAQN